MGKLAPNGGKTEAVCDEKVAGKENGESDDKKKNRKKDKKKKMMKEKKRTQREAAGEVSEAAELPEKDVETEEIDFWVPPVGSRWDNDGGDRWGSGSDSESESGEDTHTGRANSNGYDEVEDSDEVVDLSELPRNKPTADDIESNSGNLRKKKKEAQPTH